MPDKVYTVLVITDSCDKYVWVYREKPTREAVIERLRNHEGNVESPLWYDGTTDVIFGVERVL